jgi:hypothetical protein
VEEPAIENHVYVVPGVNWDLSRTHLADDIHVKDDPDSYYSLEMIDDPLTPEAEAPSAQASAAAIGAGAQGKQVKRKVLIRHKHHKHARTAVRPNKPNGTKCR